jgi:hypothetical protein
MQNSRREEERGGERRGWGETKKGYVVGPLWIYLEKWQTHKSTQSHVMLVAVAQCVLD